MTEPGTTPTHAEPYAERVRAEQAQRTAEREARRASFEYNRNAPADYANGDAA